MQKIKTSRQLSIILLFLFSTSSFCAEKNIEFSADSMKGSVKEKSNSTILSGNAYVKTESMEISADSISMSGNNFRFINAAGNVKGSNSQSKMEFSCGSLEYDRETKIVTLKNTVSLKDTEKGVAAEAQIIDYNQNTDIAIMQIMVTIKQKDNVCTSAYAIYRKKEQMLDMSGNSKIIQGKDTFRAQEITLNLDTQEITLNGRVSGSVTDSGNQSSSKSGTAVKEKTDTSIPPVEETDQNLINKEANSSVTDDTQEEKDE